MCNCKICNGVREIMTTLGNGEHEVLKCQCSGGPKVVEAPNGGYYLLGELNRKEEMEAMGYSMPELDVFFPNQNGLIDHSIRKKYDMYLNKVSRVRGAKPLPIQEWVSLLTQTGF